ncbi:MAG: hypothetical protein AAFV53_17390 [Myxococcota bacterium]
MPVEELFSQLLEMPGVLARRNEPMARHTPLRVGGRAAIWAVVEDLPAVQGVLKATRAEKVRWRVHWPMEDCIVRESGYQGLILRPGRGFEGAGRRDSGRVWLRAASPWSALTPLTRLTLTRWPGTLGGLFAAGEQSRLKGVGLTMRWLKGRREIERRVDPGEEIPSLKPSEILIEVELDEELPRRVRLRPPPGPGRLFAEPKGGDVGELLLRAGVCGARLRGWQFSDVEPGTVVHLQRDENGQDSKDVLLLARGVAERVKRARGVSLDMRIPIFGVRS